MELAGGSRWKSAVCDTEVIVVRPPDDPGALGCGGVEMVPLGKSAITAQLDPELASGTQLGKRYTDEKSGIEVLCTKPGAGTLTFDGTPLELKSAKPLPSSD
jgi:hypothetical protein